VLFQPHCRRASIVRLHRKFKSLQYRLRAASDTMLSQTDHVHLNRPRCSNFARKLASNRNDIISSANKTAAIPYTSVCLRTAMDCVDLGRLSTNSNRCSFGRITVPVAGVEDIRQTSAPITITSVAPANYDWCRRCPPSPPRHPQTIITL
jgi:hypothetical protein